MMNIQDDIKQLTVLTFTQIRSLLILFKKRIEKMASVIYADNSQYVHKKFGKRQRSDDEEDSNSAEKKSNTIEKTYLKQSVYLSKLNGFISPEQDKQTKCKNLKRKFTTCSHNNSTVKKICQDNNISNANGNISTLQISPIRHNDAISAACSSTTNPTNKLNSFNAILPNINEETFNNICKYRSNMVRSFPPKQRSAKDQERRDKNTLACRMSRRVKKLEHFAIEEQYKVKTQQFQNVTDQNIILCSYFKYLIALNQHMEQGNVTVRNKGMARKNEEREGNIDDEDIDVEIIDDEETSKSNESLNTEDDNKIVTEYYQHGQNILQQLKNSRQFVRDNRLNIAIERYRKNFLQQTKNIQQSNFKEQNQYQQRIVKQDYNQNVVLKHDRQNIANAQYRQNFLQGIANIPNEPTNYVQQKSFFINDILRPN